MVKSTRPKPVTAGRTHGGDNSDVFARKRRSVEEWLDDYALAQLERQARYDRGGARNAGTWAGYAE